MSIFEILDYAGVAVFAATGALAASRKQLDLIGFFFLASLTGIGGGTIRDLVLGRDPLFWIENHYFLGVCLLTAAILYVAAPMVEYRYRLLLWLDAVGLAAYSVLGAHIGLSAGAPPLAAITTGVVTATFGGILRDVISSEPTVLMRKEIYVTAALTGSIFYVVLSIAGADPAISVGISVLAAFAVRGGALLFGWTLPGYTHRAGRPVREAEQGKKRAVQP